VRPNVTVAVVIDTSGSMGEKELSTAIAEVGGIIKSHVGPEGIEVLSVDAALSASQKVFSKRQIKLSGGGGTDMGVGIKAVDERRNKPDFCVVITDGYTPWPETKPGMEVVIALTESNQKNNCPSYARTVVIE